MFISEVSFPHLIAASDERLAEELERRRIVDERRAEEASPMGRRARRAASRRGIRRAVDPSLGGFATAGARAGRG
ncbi:hypothetical protein [Agromyces badenianii]|uniref:hypothetical protein n=1 Tax=Agromyces badenianii TaxID=2080742 RepID=UPI000D5937D1|nr:hypothetical protein [Agromyces badenianii]PWC05288.1 hypothetical protein DCE94_03075 [Agromyces badenianii]